MGRLAVVVDLEPLVARATTVLGSITCGAMAHLVEVGELLRAQMDQVPLGTIGAGQGTTLRWNVTNGVGGVSVTLSTVGGVAAACHLFRHTCATVLLENGMDTRYIQAILGHASLESTQIYTWVSITALKALHTATHPGKMPVQGSHGLEDGQGTLGDPPAIPG